MAIVEERPVEAAIQTIPNAIEVRNVVKDFKMYHRNFYSLKSQALAAAQGLMKKDRPRVPHFEIRHAIKDVSFHVKTGEVVAIIGRNGSGKSTMLMLLSRVYLPTSGDLRIRGRSLSLLELGAGFNPELTGRENVYFNASVHGVSEATIEERYDSIVAFSGLDHQAMDLPTRSYSSGMQIRLAFAVTVHLDADVLLVDEGLAVGDESFRAKCYNRMHEFKAAGKTILMVTHDLMAVQMLADRVIWLDQEVIRAEGEVDDITARYREEMYAHVKDAPI